MPDINTLVADIYNVLDGNNDHECSEAFLEMAAESLKDILRSRLRKQDRRGSIRFSSLGKPDCQVWYGINKPEVAEPITPETQMKFLYGDVLEIVMLFLAKEAGHDVSDEQAEVEEDGVLGHIDAVIDGHVVDVKSASSYAFRKFQGDWTGEDDPFGYTAQLGGYCNVLEKPGAFLAINKESGGISLSRLSPALVQENPPGTNIARQRAAEALDSVPRCFESVPDGKSGNQKLGLNCSYCAYKKDCWPGLRGFLYSGKPRFLTTVVREPDVLEFNI
mgnify:CR=1 FL=1